MPSHVASSDIMAFNELIAMILWKGTEDFSITGFCLSLSLDNDSNHYLVNELIEVTKVIVGRRNLNAH